ncbi:hypothetical protein N9J92_00895 [Polaribacter sp.]|nr:hypothetical protein [Polaribacter sp.]MDA9092404.1 hypothetical protein [Polaribacter sp.]
MTKKKKNLISIVPAFVLIGTAIGIQTRNIFLHTVIGFFAGVLVYFFLNNKNSNS